MLQYAICYILYSCYAVLQYAICYILYAVSPPAAPGEDSTKDMEYAIHYSYTLCWTLPCNPMRWNAIWQLHPRIWNLLFFFRMQLHSISRFAVFANLALTCVMSWRTLTNIFTTSQYFLQFLTIVDDCWKCLSIMRICETNRIFVYNFYNIWQFLKY